jgi:DNA-binding MarR family transcriptional regulator
MRFDTPPPEPLASATGFLLSWNGRRTAHLFEQALESLDLRPPHFGVMTLIDANPGSTQQDLGRKSLIDPSTMVAMVDDLEARGLAERRPHSSDRRKHAVHLTADGKRTLKQARQKAAAVAEETLAPLDEEERETLRLLLRKLAGVSD